jgi:hypothetical protein
VSWAEFVQIQKRSLLSTPEESWDNQWLADLYLFNVVVRDSNECASHMPVAIGAFDLGEFFRELVSKQKVSLEKLLTAYASQDAAAVLRVAELCKIDLPTEFAEIIISNCDQMPFFALLRDQASREPERLRLWSQLFAESGLRYRVVSETLSRSALIHSWLSAVEKIPRKTRWFHWPELPLTFYTQCVSLAMGAPKAELSSLPMLNRLANLPAPGSFYPTWIVGVLLSGVFVAFLGIGVFAVIVTAARSIWEMQGESVEDLARIYNAFWMIEKEQYSLGFISRVFIGAGIGVALELVSFRLIGLMRAYRRILGTATNIDGESLSARLTFRDILVNLFRRDTLIPFRTLLPAKLIAAVAEFEEVRVGGGVR